ncbi:hypothetical protein Tdes44962_MAKER10358, partial [Teratosphaeria destructans]
MAFFAFSHLPPHSVVHADQFINLGASNHPVLIVGQQQAGAISICCLTTSLSSRTVHDKFPGAHNPARTKYLAINHQGKTRPHNDFPVLRLADDGSMDKQSYVCLVSFFRVETQYLQHFSTGGLHLDDASIAHFQTIFRATLAERFPRKQGYQIASALDWKRWSWQELGVPAGPVWQPTQRAPKASPLACPPPPLPLLQTGYPVSTVAPWANGGRRWDVHLYVVPATNLLLRQESQETPV